MRTDPTDPLGRLAAHAAQTYPKDHLTPVALVAYWRDHYRDEAAGLADDALAARLADAERELAAIGGGAGMAPITDAACARKDRLAGLALALRIVRNDRAMRRREPRPLHGRIGAEHDNP